MPLRPCLGCGRPTPGNRCEACRKDKERLREGRGTTTERGYGASHQQERSAWEPAVAAGRVLCRRAPYGLCLAADPVIRADERWHLGHPDHQCPAPTAPEHERCNVAASNQTAP